MLKTLPSKSEKSAKNLKPKDLTLFSILNYSKSLTSQTVNENKVLINLN
jgi:hypothetical protein